MQDKKFKMIDEAFTCYNCGKEVEPLNYTARDHCPNCLHSLHLDINPGDRASNCKGHLIPTGIEKNKKRGYKILYKDGYLDCTKKASVRYLRHGANQYNKRCMERSRYALIISFT